LAGKADDADKMALKATLAEKLEAIKASRDRELELHAERADDINRMAAEDAAAAKADFDLSNEELARRRALQFRVGLPGGISGDAGILKGITGDTSASPIERTAKATEAFGKKLDALIDVLTRGTTTISVIPAPP
jgi:hypothetical protein